MLCVVTFRRAVAQLYLSMLNSLKVCLFQEAPATERAEKLLDILYLREDELVPVFYEALVETGQSHVAHMLGYEGLHTFVVLLILCLL